MLSLDNARIAVVGLGYVGLPLAVAFGKRFDTLGLDLSTPRIEALKGGVDHTLEVTTEELAAASRLAYSANPADLAGRNIFIVTVPTPIDEAKRPDLTAIRKASESIGAHLSPGAVVVYESTVYPGCTEEICVPILEKLSGLTFNKDFFCGYSPERINPGDKLHRLETITKVTAGSTPEAADLIDDLYAAIVTAGTHKASSIKVAEAAKVIENTQRDLNIALINEIAMIFGKMGIDTLEVLQAAGTKWNFLGFRPGLVGGHCIGVDPYYLTHKAQEIGHHPEVILAGRRINDGMAAHVASQILKLVLGRGINPIGAKVLVLGLAFKEDCPDLRNTKVKDLVDELKAYGLDIDIHDPWVDPAEAVHEYGLTLTEQPKAGDYSAVVLAVAHKQFLELGADGVRAFGKPGAVLYDIKSALPRDKVDGRL
ncbi:MAG: Vi polysaccharide biosynthesis protein VipA/TviB [Caulobacter sp.]|jgi:UDP-N-acetyl-D-galactosamine dehydrogenase|nr:Vi polysaccharide biosynthesis protein VipA/TviB [Caulobacter sp.]